MAVAQDAKQPILFEREVMKVTITILGEAAEITVEGKGVTVEVDHETETGIKEKAKVRLKGYPDDDIDEDEDEKCECFGEYDELDEECTSECPERKNCKSFVSEDDVQAEDRTHRVGKRAGVPKISPLTDSLKITGATTGRFSSEVGKHRISDKKDGTPNCLNKFWFGGHACGDSGNCDYVVGCRAASPRKKAEEEV